MKNVFVFLLSLISFASFSQLSSYKFENTLKDEIGSYDAIHTTNGQINNQSEFINEGNINKVY